MSECTRFNNYVLLSIIIFVQETTIRNIATEFRNYTVRTDSDINGDLTLDDKNIGLRPVTDQDSGFEDSEKLDLQLSQACTNQVNDINSQPVIDPNQLYQLQLQQYHAWMYYQQQSEHGYNVQSSVLHYKREINNANPF